MIEDASVAVGLGYGESKYVAERVRLFQSVIHSNSTQINFIDNCKKWLTSNVPPNWPGNWWASKRSLACHGLGAHPREIQRGDGHTSGD